MNAGKNRKRDLELLSEVYSEGMAKYYDAQATGNYDSSGNPLDNVGGHETHSDYAGEAEDQNPVENYEGEEESQQRRSARQLEDEGYTGGKADTKGNLLYRKSSGKMYADNASVDTDGQINGMPSQEFFRGTGVEDAEDFGSPNSNRSGWGSDAFTHPGGDEATDEDEHQSIRKLAKQMAHEDEGGILDIGGDDCEQTPGRIDVVLNPASAFGVRDILKGIFSRGDEEGQEEFPWPKEVDDDEDFDDFEGTPDTDKADEKHFKAINPEQWAKAKKAGWSGGASENQEDDDEDVDSDDGDQEPPNPWERTMPRHQDWLKPHHDRIRGETPEPVIPKDDEDENAAAAMRADERENKKNLRAQNRLAKKYGFNPDENEEYDEDEVDREGRYKKRWGKDLDDEKDRKGSSNAGEYTHVDKGEFCGPSGGAADGTYPVNTRKRAEAAKRLAHNAPNPKGIKKCADRALAKDSYYSSKGDRTMTQLMESYEQVIQNELL